MIGDTSCERTPLHLAEVGRVEGGHLVVGDLGRPASTAPPPRRPPRLSPCFLAASANSCLAMISFERLATAVIQLERGLGVLGGIVDRHCSSRSAIVMVRSPMRATTSEAPAGAGRDGTNRRSRTSAAAAPAPSTMIALQAVPLSFDAPS